MELLTWFGILILSLAVLVKASDFFTDFSERLGMKVGLSAFIIGATVVSMGTSMPELVTSTIATLSGEPELLSFAIDNIIGSNIANALLVIGIGAILVGELKAKKILIEIDLPFFFIASALFIMFILDGKFTWIEGVTSLALSIVFLFYTLSQEQRVENREYVPRMLTFFKFQRQESVGLLLFLIAIAAFFIYLGGQWTVNSVLTLSDLLGLSSSKLTLVLVALGTSLPEIVVSVTAAKKGNHGIAIGNAFGSNIFNVLLVAGIPSLFATLTVSNTVLTVGIPFFIVASLACIFSTMDNRVKYFEGYALVILYIAFVGTISGLF